MTQSASEHSIRHRRSAAALTVEGIAVVLATIALAVLAFTAHTVRYFDIDLSLARALQGIHAGAFELAMNLVGAPGYPPQVYALIVIMLGILLAFKLRWEALMEVFATVGIGVVGLIVKILVDRPRPTPDLINVVTALDNGKQSFPAGHVESYVAILGFLWYLSYTLLPKNSFSRVVELMVYGVMIVLIGVSRVYVGEHWLSDVVGGYLLGGIWLWLTIKIYEWGKPHFFKTERSNINGKH
jgi:membrane-associated phospholipid phosphatase